MPVITIDEYAPPNKSPAIIPSLSIANVKNVLIPAPITLAAGPITANAKNPVNNTVINGVNKISKISGTIFLYLFLYKT